MDLLIDFKNVSLIKEGKTILNDINFEIRRGENWIIFGHNGSGKTMLLQILEGYLLPTRGEISRFGEKDGESDLRELRKRTGFLSSTIKKFMHNNENVLEAVISGKFASIGIYDAYTPQDKNKAQELLNSAGILYLKDRTYGNLSDGEKERVLIARALMSDPEMLILDEPCSHLDIPGREGVLKTLSGIHTANPSLSIILVTHHVDEIIPLFKHMLILKDGKVFQSGASDDLLTSETISGALGIGLDVFKQHNRYGCIVKDN